MNDLFNLTVDSREAVIYKGSVKSISSFNEKGKFDILKEHANFISLIQNRLIVIGADEKRFEIPLNNALLRARGNNVEVYIGVQNLLKNIY